MIERILFYQLAVAVFMAICYLPYHLFWRRAIKFSERRFYLLSLIVASFILPLLPISIGTVARVEVDAIMLANYFQTFSSQSPESVLVALEGIEGSGKSYGFLWFITIVGFAISASYLLLLGSSFAKGQRLKFQAEGCCQYKNTKVYILPEGTGCFTFMQSIFIGSDLYHSPNRELLLSHEEAHICSFHFIDLVVFHIAKALQWFNPVVHFIGSEDKSDSRIFCRSQCSGINHKPKKLPCSTL